MENLLPPVHPGEILQDELREIELSANAFAKALQCGPPSSPVYRPLSCLCHLPSVI